MSTVHPSEDLLALVSVNAAPAMASLLMQRQLLQASLLNCHAESKRLSEAIGDRELALGMALARTGGDLDYDEDAVLLDLHGQQESTEQKRRILDLALSTLTSDIDLLADRVRLDIECCLRQRTLDTVSELLSALTVAQEHYAALDSLLQNGLRLIAQQARYVVAGEILDPRLPDRLTMLRTWHVAESATLARLTAKAHEAQVQ